MHCTVTQPSPTRHRVSKRGTTGSSTQVAVICPKRIPLALLPADDRKSTRNAPSRPPLSHCTNIRRLRRHPCRRWHPSRTHQQRRGAPWHCPAGKRHRGGHEGAKVSCAGKPKESACKAHTRLLFVDVSTYPLPDGHGHLGPLRTLLQPVVHPDRSTALTNAK